jgi:nucleoside-diphosphate-sugar epimerase
MNQLAREHPEGIIPFPVQGTGEETRSFCYIGDCVDQLVLLLGKSYRMQRRQRRYPAARKRDVVRREALRLDLASATVDARRDMDGKTCCTRRARHWQAMREERPIFRHDIE